MKHLLCLLLLVGMQAYTPRPFAEEKRLALLIGNAKYEHVSSLTNTVHDVTDIANILRGKEYGFEVTLETNRTYQQMTNDINAFVKKVKTVQEQGYHTIAFVYFAGHAVQYKKMNYLLPVDINTQECEELDYVSYNLDRLPKALASANAKILMIDACRTPPTGTSCLRDLGTPGLVATASPDNAPKTHMELARGSIIAYSASENQPAKDVGSNQRNSPYAEAFLQLLKQEKDANALFDELSDVVASKTTDEQIPYKSGSLRFGKFYFKKPENKPTPVLPTEKKEEPKKETAEKRGLDLPNFVYVEGGTFTMGCTSEQGSDCNEKNTKTLTVGSFMMSNAEVTVGEFAKFIQATNHQTDAEKEGSSYILKNGSWASEKGITWKHDYKGDLRPQSEYDHPVIHVSWHDATAYCSWISKTTGRTYRLPTEAEWEYAARGGKKTKGYKYAGTTTTIDNYAWYTTNTQDKGTKPVRTKQANELGLYDMSGNVWEWCSDWYVDNYSKYPATAGAYRVLRSGSWFTYAQGCRVGYRLNYAPANRNGYVGFRVLVSL